MFLNWILQSKEWNPENFNTLAITLKQHASRQELHGEITGNLAQKSPGGNMHKLFDCIRIPLKSFLAYLTFHRKKYDFVICISGRTLDPPPANLVVV